MLDKLIAILISGMILGSIYALMSLGLSLIWGILKVLNWAHGALFMFAAYITWFFIYVLGFSYLVSVFICLAILFLMGLALYYSLIKPFLQKPNFLLATIISTLGFAVMSESIALILFGSRYKKIESPISGSIIIGTSPITGGNFLILSASIITFIVIYLFLTKTKYGLALRAVAQNLDGARVVGINVDKIYAYTVGISAVLAAIAGILVSSIYFIEPHVGFIPMMKAFVAIVLGGLGSWKGTMIAAYVTGIIEAAASLLVGLMWALPTLFLMMMLILVIKPTGFFGYEE